MLPVLTSPCGFRKEILSCEPTRKASRVSDNDFFCESWAPLIAEPFEANDIDCDAFDRTRSAQDFGADITTGDFKTETVSGAGGVASVAF